MEVMDKVNHIPFSEILELQTINQTEQVIYEGLSYDAKAKSV